MAALSSRLRTIGLLTLAFGAIQGCATPRPAERPAEPRRLKDTPTEARAAEPPPPGVDREGHPAAVERRFGNEEARARAEAEAKRRADANKDKGQHVEPEPSSKPPTKTP